MRAAPGIYETERVVGHAQQLYARIAPSPEDNSLR
jgi:hypothetical protein